MYHLLSISKLRHCHHVVYLATDVSVDSSVSSSTCLSVHPFLSVCSSVLAAFTYFLSLKSPCSTVGANKKPSDCIWTRPKTHTHVHAQTCADQNYFWRYLHSRNLHQRNFRWSDQLQKTAVKGTVKRTKRSRCPIDTKGLLSSQICLSSPQAY